MAMIKQMGGYFALIGSTGKKPLYKEQMFYVEDIDLIDHLMINGVSVEHDSLESLIRLEENAFSVEKCDDMVDFLLLSKMDFEEESKL